MRRNILSKWRTTTGCLALLLAFVLLASCEHKELCEYHPHRAKVRVNVDWSKFTKTKPTGMTVKVYPSGGIAPYTQLTHNLAYAEMDLEAGLYSTLVFNQSEEEYGTVSFRNLDNYQNAEVYTNTTRSTWYETRNEDEKLGSNPEWIGVDAQQNALVSEEMVEGTGKYARTRAGKVEVAPYYVMNTLTPENIVSTVTIKVHIKGIHNVRSARGAIDGMAEGYYLTQGRATDKKVTQLIEEWTKVVDKSDPTKGYLVAQVTCFGLPNGHEGLPEENKLTVSLLLVDNKTVTEYEFGVGDKFEYTAEEELKTSLTMEVEVTLDTAIPDVQPEGATGGMFDATVDDWGEEVQVEIEM